MTQSLSFNCGDLAALYTAKKHHDLAEAFLAILRHFHEQTYTEITPDQQTFLDTFIRTFLYFFTHTDFVLSDDHAEQFVRLNLTISNLVACSCWKNTDPWVNILLRQPANAVKFFALYSARNTIKLPPERKERIFNVAPKLASLWYCLYGHCYRGGLVRREVCENLSEHYRYEHPRLFAGFDVQELYFGSSYVPEGGDKEIKGKVNACLRQEAGNARITINSTPNPSKIAVLSSMWKPGHSVHRTCVDYVRGLRGKYHLTLIVLGEGDEHVDKEGFDEVRRIEFKNGIFDMSDYREVDYSLCYFPDIGMSPHSIFLANLRLAPVQILGTGHPLSCFDGSCMDAFISGGEVEVPDAQKHYSERLVLLKGMGGIHTRPDYKPVGRQSSNSRVVIGCPAAAHKINWRFVEALKEIVKTGALLRMFVGGSANRQMDFLALRKDLEAALGAANLEVLKGLAYQDYMAQLEQCDFAIDSFPFGGSNVVNDCLAIGLPVVCLEGKRWPDRIGAAMLRRAGLEQLAHYEETYRFAARDEQEYVNVVRHLASSRELIGVARQMFAMADLDGTLYERSLRDREVEDFVTVVGELIGGKVKS